MVSGDILHRYQKHNAKPSHKFYNFVLNDGNYLNKKIIKDLEKEERKKILNEYEKSL